MTTPRPRAEVVALLRHVGYDVDLVTEVEQALPDPVDLDEHADVLLRHGLSRERLEDELGGSP